MVSAFPSHVLASNEDSHPDRQSALVMRNISVRGHRTSIRLEPQIWESMTEICRREFCTLHDVCSYVAERKPPHGSLTSSLRVFILNYFRTCATEDGHHRTGHGQGMFMSQQQERLQMRKLKADGLHR
jgi:predicted DNA-binding ribbon-helix-helix protein